MEKQDAGDARALFLRHVYQKEINKVMTCVGELVVQQGMPSLWILKDNSIAAEHNIAVIGGVFRSILRSESPRLFPVYAPLPILATGDTLQEVARLLLDRFQEQVFRRCIYAFVYQELQELVESGRESQVLPEMDVADLLQRMEQTPGEAVDEILFPLGGKSGVNSQESEGEEGPSEVRSQESEGEEEEQSEVPSTPPTEGLRAGSSQQSEGIESEKERRQREQAEHLANFIAEAAKRKQFGEQIESVVEVSVRSGLDIGYSNFSQLAAHRDLITGLARLLLYVFEKMVVVVDQLEFWDLLEDPQKARFMGAISEFEWLARDKAVLMFSSYPEQVESIGPAYSARFKKQALDLGLSNVNAESSTSGEQAAGILVQFLTSDPYRNQKLPYLKKKKMSELHPFTREGVQLITEHEDGRIAAILDVAEKLLDEGGGAGYPVIGHEFVEKRLEARK